MGIAGNAAVEATPLAAPRVGLIATARELVVFEESVSSASTDSNPTPRWENGFAWAPENGCSTIGIVDPCATTAKTVGENPEERSYDPVGLWAGDQCTTRGVRDRQGRARRRLLAGQSRKLAQELWNGALAIGAGFPNAYLSDTLLANTVTAGAATPTAGLACLEDSLAACGLGTSVIHATPGLMTHWKALHLVERFGNVFRTVNDTIVIADAGYTGEGPGVGPVTSGHVWAYGTDAVFVRLGQIDVFPRSEAEAMTLTPEADNLLTYRAERLAAATFDGCCHVAAEFDIPICANPQTS